MNNDKKIKTLIIAILVALTTEATNLIIDFLKGWI